MSGIEKKPTWTSTISDDNGLTRVPSDIQRMLDAYSDDEIEWVYEDGELKVRSK